MRKDRAEKNYNFTWWMHLSNSYHQFMMNLPWKKGRGYCHTHYPTPQEAWFSRNQTHPDKDVAREVHLKFKMVVKYDYKNNDFWILNEKGRLSLKKRKKGEIRRPFIGYGCNGCNMAGEFNLFEIPGKDGGYCYPCAWKTLV